MKNKIIVIILAVSSLIIMSLLGTKLLNEDYSFKPRNDYYKLDTSYIRFETDEFTAYLKGTWEDIDSIAYINLDVVYDFKLIKANSKSTILGVYFDNKYLMFETQILNDRTIPFFKEKININNQIVKEIDSRNNQDYPVSFNQFLFMYQHENMFYNSETSKEEKVESIRIKFNFKFKAINSGLLATVIKGVAVNQVNGRLHQFDEIFYDSKKNIVTKNNNTKPFKRIEYSKAGNINEH